MTTNRYSEAPQALQNWFILHFVVDLFFAFPLMLVPEWFLSLLGWHTIDPVAARLVAAALVGIGLSSYLSRGTSLDAYTELLNLKIIWSFAAIFGLLLSLLQSAQGRPLVLWILLVVFIFFNAVWIYWHRKVHSMINQELPDS